MNQIPATQIRPTEAAYILTDDGSEMVHRLRPSWDSIQTAFVVTPGEQTVWSAIIGMALRFPSVTQQVLLAFEPDEIPRGMDRLMLDHVRTYWERHQAVIPLDALPNAYWATAMDYMDAVVSPAGIEAYIEAAREYVERRKLGKRLGAALESLASGSEVHEVRAETLASMVAAPGKNKRVTFAEAVDRVLTREPAWVLPTGIKALDSYLAIRRGNLGIIAARPGVGKSSLMRQMALTAEQFGRVVVCSLEMSPAEVAQATLACALERPAREITFANLGDRGIAAVQRQARLNIEFHELPKVADLELAVRAAQTEGPVSCVMVDYLQLMRPAKAMSSTNENVTQISRDLKLLASKLDVPVIALSQLSRSAAKEEPELWHLRDSGAIEQDANWILFIHPDQQGNEESDRVELLLKKNRSGRIGKTACRFDKRIGRFWQV
jgi:replicative DNA helicase